MAPSYDVEITVRIEEAGGVRQAVYTLVARDTAGNPVMSANGTNLEAAGEALAEGLLTL